MNLSPRAWIDVMRSHPARRRLALKCLHTLSPVWFTLARGWRRTGLRRTRIIAITGSFGKSTTMRAISTALGLPIHKYATHNSRFFMAWAVLRIPPRRPLAAIELGINGPGQMITYARILRPDIAIATAVGSEHNATLQTLERTREEKGLLVRHVARGGIALLNGDDPNVMWMRSQTRERVVTFGFSEGCDVRALEAELDWPGGMRLRASVFGEEVEVRTRLLGRPSVYPMLAALAVTRLEGLPLGPAVERLAMLEPGKLRLEPALLPCGAWVLRDEFKAAVETYEAALEVAGQIPARRKIMVLGLIEEPMESDTIVYRQIGRWAGVVAERIIFIGGRKQSRLVRQGAVESGLAPEMVFKAGQLVHGALQFIPEDLGPGDLVLLKGRSSQRLDRIWYALSGRTVRCTIEQCNTVATRCAYCNMLERGWEGRRVVI